MQNYNGSWESIRKHKVPKWYEDCKFGIFIHWGLYSVPAYAPSTCELGEIPGDEQWFCNNPYAEWYYNSVNVGQGPSYEYHIKKYGKQYPYENFALEWKAENWKPQKWAKLFKQAGARYVVLTTKHHDGFCLFPSAYTDYNAMVKGPRRDITGELTRAVREEGLRMGLYYSAMIDWRFAHDPIYREEDNFLKACPTYEYADYAYKQCCELIDNYQPSVLWNDIGWPKQGEINLPYMLAHYYNTVEEGVVNDRFSGLWKDFSTKEYKYGEVSRQEKWEMNRGMGLSFGYNAYESEDYLLSTEGIIRLLAETVSNNGNLLLNVGPKADGTIPEEQEKRLLQVGKWLEINGEAIYDTRCCEQSFSAKQGPAEVYCTAKDGQRYLLVSNLPEGHVDVEVCGAHKTAIPLDTGAGITSEKTDSGIILHIPSGKAVMGTVAFKITE